MVTICETSATWSKDEAAILAHSTISRYSAIYARAQEVWGERVEWPHRFECMRGALRMAGEIRHAIDAGEDWNAAAREVYNLTGYLLTVII